MHVGLAVVGIAVVGRNVGVGLLGVGNAVVGLDVGRGVGHVLLGVFPEQVFPLQQGRL